MSHYTEADVGKRLTNVPMFVGLDYLYLSGKAGILYWVGLDLGVGSVPVWCRWLKAGKPGFAARVFSIRPSAYSGRTGCCKALSGGESRMPGLDLTDMRIPSSTKPNCHPTYHSQPHHRQHFPHPEPPHPPVPTHALPHTHTTPADSPPAASDKSTSGDCATCTPI